MTSLNLPFQPGSPAEGSVHDSGHFGPIPGTLFMARIEVGQESLAHAPSQVKGLKPPARDSRLGVR